MRVKTLPNNFILGFPLLLAVTIGFVMLALLAYFFRPATQTFGGNAEIIRLSEGSVQLRLDNCNLIEFKSEFAELLMVENVSDIDSRNSILDEEVVGSLLQEGSLKKLGLNRCVLTVGCVPLICDLSQLKKLTIIGCGLDRVSLAEINSSLTGCEVIPRVALAP